MVPDPPPIRSDQLREGDVLLSYSKDGFGSPAYFARLLDTGDYSHAAYWTGASVIEAVGSGVREIPLDQTLPKQEYLHAYRYVPSNAVGRGSGFDPSRVTKRARTFVGARYAPARLVTIGVLVGLGRASGVPAIREFLASDLRLELRREIEQIRNSGAPAPMICSELVATAFFDATDDHAYALEVVYDPSGFGRFLSDDARSPEQRLREDEIRALEDLRRLCAESLAIGEEQDVEAPSIESSPEPRHDRFLGAAPVRATLGGSIKLTRVTPGDLQASCSLALVGHVVG